MSRILGSNCDARGSDIEFRRHGNIPMEDAAAPATSTVPDFVIEVITPSDRPDMMAGKVRDWLRAGVQLLWYVDPVTGDTTVYQGELVIQVLAHEALDSGEVVPGFSLRLRDVLDELNAELTQH
jgi:Uma2 family endonuclease